MISETDFVKFQPELIGFLEDLSHNNNREWFSANKSRYEEDVLEPVMAFIRAMQPRLMGISPYLLAEAKRVGGSMFRIYRDTRFSKDKTPNKTHVGIHFSHREGKEKTAPGFYVHIGSKEVYLAIGVWRPDSASLVKIRARIDLDSKLWLKARDDKAFRKAFELQGDSLTSPPRGYPKDHPLLDDLKRKDFVVVHELSVKELFKAGFLDRVTKAFGVSRPYMAFLSEALEVPF